MHQGAHAPGGIFATQGSNPGLLHCKQMLYHLSHQESFNIWLKTSRGDLFLPLFHVYVRSFFYLFYTLIKLYYTHTHTHTHTRESEITVRNCRFLLGKALEQGMGVVKVEPSKPRLLDNNHHLLFPFPISEDLHTLF